METPRTLLKRGESLQRSQTRAENKHDRTGLRRSHSEDLLYGPSSKHMHGRRKRGEINVRIVDFAHTTTGRDWLPYPSTQDGVDGPAVTSSEGYTADVDPETGLLYARFPPHFPNQPDRGFLYGLKNLAMTLEWIWNEERIERVKASREDPSIIGSQLPPLPTYGKEIFDEIFPPSAEDLGEIST